MHVAPRVTTTYASLEAWLSEGVRRFGKDTNAWRFVCPCCQHVASVADWKAAGAGQGEIGFSCIGRRMAAPPRGAFGKGPGPCDYAGGGLFRLNPAIITGGNTDGSDAQRFAFAEVTP